MMKLFLEHNLKSAKSNFRSVGVVKFTKWLQRLKEVVKRHFKKRLSQTPPASLHYVQWSYNTLIANIYPGNPFSREQLVLSLLRAWVDVWGPAPLDGISFLPRENQLVLFTEDTVSSLMHGVLSRFDSCRGMSYELLSLCPGPLPGFQDYNPVMQFAYQLLYSQRSRECETSAFLMLLGYQKYFSPFQEIFENVKSSMVLEFPTQPDGRQKISLFFLIL
jgi:hypothetical protein